MTRASIAEQTATAALLPQPGRTYEDEQRLHHLDLAELTSDKLWAERQLLAQALARMIFDNSRALLCCVPEPLSAVDWMKTRVRLLDAELAKRRKGPRL